MARQFDIRVVGGSLPIDVNNKTRPKSRGEKFLERVKDIAPVFTALAGISVSIFVYLLNDRQTATNESSLRAKAINDLSTAADNGRRELAAIAFAEYGEETLPAIRSFLSAKDSNSVTAGAYMVKVLYDRGAKDQRIARKFLDECLETPNKQLKIGALESYQEILKAYPSEEIMVGLAEFLKKEPDSRVLEGVYLAITTAIGPLSRKSLESVRSAIEQRAASSPNAAAGALAHIRNLESTN